MAENEGQDPAPQSDNEGDESKTPKAPEGNEGDAPAAKPTLLGEGEGDAPAEEEGAPETYEPFTVPEGIELDSSLSEKFNTLAKELNLSQEKAQGLMDMANENVVANTKKQEAEWAETRDKWVSEIKLDKEFGGLKFDQTMVEAKRALKTYGDGELAAFLENTGYGDNPAVIKMLAKVGRQIAEDTTEEGAPPSEPKDAAQIMFGKK